MFFISGLERNILPELSHGKFVFSDGAGAEWTCNSPYSIKSDKGTVVGTTAGNLTALPIEPVPPGIREEPPH
jgi:hypothetical protein